MNKYEITHPPEKRENTFSHLIPNVVRHLERKKRLIKHLTVENFLFTQRIMISRRSKIFCLTHFPFGDLKTSLGGTVSASASSSFITYSCINTSVSAIPVDH